MDYKVKIPLVVSNFQCCVTGHVNPRCLSVSQCGNYFARGCAVLSLGKEVSCVKFYGSYLVLYARPYLSFAVTNSVSTCK
jgi:hypothetical protein